jgi:hypothetical protein
MSGPILDFDAPEMMGTPGTIFWWLVLFGAFGVLIARLVVGARRAARMAAKKERDARGAELPLSPGERVVEGHVELAGGESTAARVEIDQEGKETENSGSWSFTWMETERRITMRPFYLRLPSGERVRVEPEDRAFLVDALDGMTVVDEIHRTRHAELTPGEYVFAAGYLDRGRDPEIPAETYRGGAGKGWVLSPPASGELLLSSELLSARFERAARARWNATVLAAVLLCVPIVLNVPGFYRCFASEAVAADVIDRREVENDDSTSYDVRIRVGDVELWKAATAESYGRATDGARTWVTWVKANPEFSALGRDTRGSGTILVPGFGSLLLSLFLTWSTLRKSKRWYEDKVKDSGSGRLAANTKAVSSSTE